MEEEGVIPEADTHATLLRVFGRASSPVFKCRRMAFWMRRFAFANPYALRTIPDGPVETATALLARLGGPGAPTHVVDSDPSCVTVVSRPKDAARVVERLLQSGEVPRVLLALLLPVKRSIWGLPESCNTLLA
jgi:hypothetical protein